MKENKEITEVTVAGETVQLVKIQDELPLQRWITWREIRDVFFGKSGAGQHAGSIATVAENGNAKYPSSAENNSLQP